MSSPQLVSDTALNDSNKTLSAPSRARLKALRVEYTASAGAGNRLLEVRFRDDGGDIVWATRLTTNIAASDVMTINFSPSAPTVAPTDDAIEGSQHIADVLFNSGWDVQVIDIAAIAAAADDMVLHSLWEAE